MVTKKRKYNEEYISYGFTVTLDRDGTEKPQCFFCGKVLANSIMKPVKLKEHLNAIYPGSIFDSRVTFLQKKARFEVSGTLDRYGFIPIEKPLLVASYKIAYRIAKEKKPYIIAETLIKPCALEMTEIVCVSDQRRKLEGSLQLDKSTDISYCSQLVFYVNANEIKEELLFWEPLLETAKASHVFQKVNNFFVKQNFDWKKKIGSICMDGAPTMLGNKSGLAALVKKRSF